MLRGGKNKSGLNPCCLREGLAPPLPFLAHVYLCPGKGAWINVFLFCPAGGLFKPFRNPVVVISVTAEKKSWDVSKSENLTRQTSGGETWKGPAGRGNFLKDISFPTHSRLSLKRSPFLVLIDLEHALAKTVFQRRFSVLFKVYCDSRTPKVP